MYSQPDSAFILANELIDFGITQKYPTAEAMGYNLQGVSKHLEGEYASALALYDKSLTVKRRIGDDAGIATTLNNIGVIYKYQGDFSRALNYYRQSLEISKKVEHKLGMANCLNNIGNIYFNELDYSNSLKYHQESLEIAKEIDDQLKIANSLGNIGNVFHNQEKYDQALRYYSEFLEISENIGDRKGMTNVLNNIGSNYGKQLKHTQSLDYFFQSLKVRKEMGDQLGIAKSLCSIGETYVILKDFKKGLEYCLDGYQTAKSIGAIETQRDGCRCVYDSYKAIGNQKEALVYHETLVLLEDSLQAKETIKSLQRMEFQKQMLADSIATAEKERLVQEAHQEEVRKKNQTRNVLAGGGLIVLILAGGLYGRVRYIRKSKAVLQTEKDRSENLLLNILPADIAAELKEKGRADARDFEMVSILFTDFKGFTAASEKLSAQDLVSEINTCFEAFDGIMGKYGIEKIKTIGDAYMAAGGLPVPTDDSVKNTVLAALEMQEFIRDRKAKLDAEGKPGFEMRVGVHTGPVVAGIVGVKKFQYDIWGDTVNTASRMESSGEVGKVNISEATYELLKDDAQFSFESRGKIEAKGKGEMEMFFVSQKG